ncbi:MAG: hypothetical protein ACLFV8_05240 [Alphaproteobacteria bacterium]
MSLLRMIGSALLLALFGMAAARANETGGNLSDILGDVNAYGRAISVARACGMETERADRAVSMVMVYAYAAAQSRLSDEHRKRMFLVQVVERVSREHEVGTPSRALCARSFKAIEHLPARLDAAVRKAG